MSAVGGGLMLAALTWIAVEPILGPYVRRLADRVLAFEDWRLR